MTSTIDIKSSSRAGRFKKKLVSPEALKCEAPLIEKKMAPVLELFRQNKITEAELTATYIILVLSHRFPGSWLGSKSQLNLAHQLNVPLRDLPLVFESNIQKRLQEFETLGEVFGHFSFRSTPLSINRAILNWSNALYPLILMFCIPDSKQVLEQQKEGRRCVTILTDSTRTQNYILGERDALSFTLHDLIHADHFYQHPELTEGQIGFYRLMHESYSQGYFKSLLENEQFVREFDYLISDMNAYPVHLMKCFKSALLHYGQNEFDQWVKGMNFNERTRGALLALNTTSYEAQAQDQFILGHLTNYL